VRVHVGSEGEDLRAQSQRTHHRDG
jgi:hypothetical protein